MYVDYMSRFGMADGIRFMLANWCVERTKSLQLIPTQTVGPHDKGIGRYITGPQDKPTCRATMGEVFCEPPSQSLPGSTLSLSYINHKPLYRKPEHSLNEIQYIEIRGLRSPLVPASCSSVHVAVVHGRRSTAADHTSAPQRSGWGMVKCGRSSACMVYSNKVYDGMVWYGMVWYSIV